MQSKLNRCVGERPMTRSATYIRLWRALRRLIARNSTVLGRFVKRPYRIALRRWVCAKSDCARAGVETRPYGVDVSPLGCSDFAGEHSSPLRCREQPLCCSATYIKLWRALRRLIARNSTVLGRAWKPAPTGCRINPNRKTQKNARLSLNRALFYKK